jgi:hypothetical protein
LISFFAVRDPDAFQGESPASVTETRAAGWGQAVGEIEARLDAVDLDFEGGERGDHSEGHVREFNSVNAESAFMFGAPRRRALVIRNETMRSFLLDGLSSGELAVYLRLRARST